MDSLRSFMDIAIVNITVGEALTAIGSLMIIVAFMVAMWHFINRITRVDDHDEIVNKHNLAYGAQRTALTAAQGIGMMGARTLLRQRLGQFGLDGRRGSVDLRSATDRAQDRRLGGPVEDQQPPSAH
ncbi:hypothetical protein IPG36_02325 [bacterium]|nr:MAG: hypothetical protein IPG36_02325 [bacterium]